MLSLTRRRFIAVSAATALPLSVSGSPAFGMGASWRGIALGASASIRIDGIDSAEAEAILGESVAEIERLEAVFSLYRPDSALSRLNRDGQLGAPPTELLSVLSVADGVHQATGGAFDPSIQPLWQLYAGHFGRAGGPRDGAGPSADALSSVLQKVGFDKVSVAASKVHFLREGMALTLNGIAQGAVTDRIAELLRERGLRHVLVDLGETRAIGPRSDGRPWRIGLSRLHASAQASSAGSDRGRISPKTVTAIERLTSGAIATSATSGTVFDDTGRFGHILDPRTGRPAARFRQVSVQAPNAVLADAYSTAFCLLSSAAASVIARERSLKVLV